jgi:putative ABC transport system substrate-binding protein
MKRRAFFIGILAIGSGFSAFAPAQQSDRSYRVLLFLGGTSPAAERQRRVISQRLTAHGFAQGRNVDIELRRGGIDQWNYDAATLIAKAKPDVVLVDSTRLASALVAMKVRIPTVFTGVDDPIAAGLVKSFARPGGNMTGVYYSQLEIASKRLQLMREFLPHARRIAIAASFGDAGVRDTMMQLSPIASKLGFELIELDGTWNFGFAGSLEGIGRSRPEAIIILQPYAFYGMEQVVQPILQQANRHRIPVACWESEIAELGALFSYGVNLVHELDRAADQLARLLKGATPAELPVDQATSYELVVNQKAATQLGIVVPGSIRIRAQRIIAD